MREERRRACLLCRVGQGPGYGGHVVPRWVSPLGLLLFFPSCADGLATVTLVGIIVGVLLAIGFIGWIIFVVVRKMSGGYS